MYTEHRNHFFTLLFITVAMVQCKAAFIKLLTTGNNLLTVVNIGRSMVKGIDKNDILVLFQADSRDDNICVGVRRRRCDTIMQQQKIMVE